MSTQIEIPTMLLEAVVALENAPHPSPCEVYIGDGCTCGLDSVLARLWPIVDANEDGHVEDGHPLQTARRHSLDSRVRSALDLADEMGDGVSPECSSFAEALRRILRSRRVDAQTREDAPYG